MGFFTRRQYEIIGKGIETEFCHLMKKYNSRKYYNGYTQVYNALFYNNRKKMQSILDIRDETHMGSSKALMEFFPYATIYTCSPAKQDEVDVPERIKAFKLPLSSPTNIVTIFYIGKMKDIDFDIIIDSTHEDIYSKHNTRSLLLPKLRMDGHYLIENIDPTDIHIEEPPCAIYQRVNFPNKNDGSSSEVIIMKKGIA